MNEYSEECLEIWLDSLFKKSSQISPAWAQYTRLLHLGIISFAISSMSVL